ncbi:uncharacterized protein LOC111391212 [Olea europaea var. sylvestris]|uniref:uncharacterized protein LOC111391212 n=1 Tax=Olea europaea var. sylvestris TaxID=158386 RepID=UPI000C1D18BE|nr:uncharacterized protein LOC111391212 [Olea europaea var. sylvestris]
MASSELAELRRQLDDLLDAGLIQPLKAPYGVPVLFQKKHYGSMRMCVNYRTLNKLTNAPATFCNLMNDVLHEFLDNFVVVYLDDIVLPDFEKPFEVHTDASDHAIRGILLREGHPITYESRKLKDTEQRYSTHEKEMTAVVHCLET